MEKQRETCQAEISRLEEQISAIKPENGWFESSIFNALLLIISMKSYFATIKNYFPLFLANSAIQQQISESTADMATLKQQLARVQAEQQHARVTAEQQLAQVTAELEQIRQEKSGSHILIILFVFNCFLSAAWPSLDLLFCFDLLFRFDLLFCFSLLFCFRLLFRFHLLFRFLSKYLFVLIDSASLSIFSIITQNLLRLC